MLYSIINRVVEIERSAFIFILCFETFFFIPFVKHLSCSGEDARPLARGEKTVGNALQHCNKLHCRYYFLQLLHLSSPSLSLQWSLNCIP